MHGKIAILFGFLAALSYVQGERLIWQDEFDFLDLGKWSHLVTGWDGGNGEFQYFRNNRKNSYVRDGKLYITPTLATEEIHDLNVGRIEDPECNMQPCQINAEGDILNPVFSARMHTKNSFSFTYGRAEIRAKMPRGDWLWPAIWMLPTNEAYGGWPRSGEIDIMEVRGNPDLRGHDGVNHGNTEAASTLHFGPAWNYKNQAGYTRQSPPGRTWSDDFYVYELIWTPDVIRFLVNGQIINECWIPNGGFAEQGGLNTDIWNGRPKSAPFDQPFHFILNVAVGGEFFPNVWQSGGKPRPWWGGDNRRQFWNARDQWLPTWGSAEDHSLQIDYIRVYQD